MVKAIKLNEEGQAVEVEVGIQAGWRWRDSNGELAQIHSWEERRWRHRDTMEYETILVARVPRLKRSDGKTEMAAVPWAERYTRWTRSFEAWAIGIIQACSSLEAARLLLRLNWSSVNAIMAGAVTRGLAKREWEDLLYVGLDEKSFLKGQSYVSVLSDVKRGVVLEVSLGKDTAAARTVLESIPPAVRPTIKAAACDLSAAIMKGIAEVLPAAEHVHDKFHVSALLGKAVDEVRRREAERLEEKGDETLKGTRFQWLYGQENLPARFAISFEALAQMNLKTSRAWLAKENFGGFWMQSEKVTAASFFKIWFGKARRSQIDPIKKVAKTFKAHLPGLLSYFAHKISNAVAEGLNSKIQSLKQAARGFRSFAAYRVRILFHCGGLDLVPSKT